MSDKIKCKVLYPIHFKDGLVRPPATIELTEKDFKLYSSKSLIESIDDDYPFEHGGFSSKQDKKEKNTKEEKAAYQTKEQKPGSTGKTRKKPGPKPKQDKD